MAWLAPAQNLPAATHCPSWMVASRAPPMHPQKKAVTASLHLLLSSSPWAVGIAAIIMIFVAGFKFDQWRRRNKVGSAKTTLIYAIIGWLWPP